VIFAHVALLAVVVLPDGLADLLARATVRPESQA